MSRDLIHLTSKKKEGGDKVATLLFVVSACAIAAVFEVTHLFLAPIDSTLAFVPDTAVVYAHAQGSRAKQGLMQVAPFALPEVTANELALYAAPDEYDDLEWHAVIAWRSPFSPTEADRAALKDADATIIDDRRYLIGETSATRIAPGTLATIPHAASTLHAAASRARIQVYVDMAKLTGSELPPVTAAVALRQNGFYADTSLLDGPNVRTPQKMTPTSESAAEASVVAGQDSLDLFTTLFGELAGNAFTTSTLSDLLNQAPYALDVDQTISGSTSIVLRLPQTPHAQLLPLLRAYATAYHPKRATLPLPDGDKMIELRAPEDTSNILTFADGELGTASIRAHGLGTIIAIPPNAPIARTRTPVRCPGPKDSVMTIRGKVLEKMLLQAGITDLPISEVAIVSSGSKGVRICGYR